MSLFVGAAQLAAAASAIAAPPVPAPAEVSAPAAAETAPTATTPPAEAVPTAEPVVEAAPAVTPAPSPPADPPPVADPAQAATAPVAGGAADVDQELTPPAPPPEPLAALDEPTPEVDPAIAAVEQRLGPVGDARVTAPAIDAVRFEASDPVRDAVGSAQGLAAAGGRGPTLDDPARSDQDLTGGVRQLAETVPTLGSPPATSTSPSSPPAAGVPPPPEPWAPVSGPDSAVLGDGLPTMPLDSGASDSGTSVSAALSTTLERLHGPEKQLPASPPGGGIGGLPGASGPTSVGFFFFAFAAILLGLLVLAGRAASRRIRSAPVRWRPVPFVSLLERPG